MPVQMDLRSHRILLANIIELREAYHAALSQRQNNYAMHLNHLMEERVRRYERAEFYSAPGDPGVGDDSGGGGEGS